MKFPQIKKRYYIPVVFWIFFVVSGSKLGIDRYLYKHELEAFRAEGYPATTDELIAWVLPEGVENAASTMDEAFAAMDWSTVEEHDVPIVGTVRWKGFRRELPEDIWDNIRLFLDANEEALGFLREATQFERCLWEENLQSNDFELSMNRYSLTRAATRAASRLLLLETIYKGHVGDIGGAFDAIEANFAVSRFLIQEPTVISSLVGSATYGMARSGSRDLVMRGTLNDEELVRLMQIVNDNPLDLELRTSFVGDYVINQSMFAVPFGEIWSSVDWLLVDSTPLEVLNEIWDILIFLSADESLAMLRMTRELIRFTEMPIKEALVAVAEANEKYAKLDTEDSLVFMTFKSQSGTFPLVMRNDLQQRITLTALNIERYRLRKGRLPAKLEDLVPEFLDALPLSPFDGEALLFETFEGGYWVGAEGSEVWDTHTYLPEIDRATGQPFVRFLRAEFGGE